MKKTSHLMVTGFLALIFLSGCVHDPVFFRNSSGVSAQAKLITQVNTSGNMHDIQGPFFEEDPIIETRGVKNLLQNPNGASGAFGQDGPTQYILAN